MYRTSFLVALNKKILEPKARIRRPLLVLLTHRKKDSRHEVLRDVKNCGNLDAIKALHRTRGDAQLSRRSETEAESDVGLALRPSKHIR